ncbi:hypothetical protein EHS25_005347 [Saitozyma podzolica]|uniref:Major facilitator superfamily (MFS) profile domain-containing protein n=1 Tax=Saitozyma podzolica TaxID=1890683 RepID=A0A427XZ69_9TREE|nr:hypothetical protein EHS25_005347 [Saitozyma podzolica]
MSAPQIQDDIKLDTIEHAEQPVSAIQASTTPHAVATVSPLQSYGLVKTITTFKYAAALCLLAGFNACSDGFQNGIPGNIIAMEGFINQFGVDVNGVKTLEATTISNWAAAYTAGYIVILLAGNWPIDYFGRKFCLLWVQLLMVVACLQQMFANNWQLWLASKLFDGLSVGLNQAVCSSYVSELAPTNARGALLACYQLWWAVGGFGASIGIQIVSTMPSSQWRHAIYSEWVFIGIALIIWVFLPESPRWYCQKGKHEQAKKILQRVNGGVEGYDLETEYAILVQEVEDGHRLAVRSSGTSFFDLFRGTNLRRTLISFGPFGWQQWIGVPVIFGYTSYFFQLAGLKEVFMGTVAVNLILVVFVAISFFTVEKVGRRRLLLIGGVLMIACLMIVGGMGTIKTQTSATGGLCLVAVYALTAGPIGYVYLAETSTVVLRAKTTTTAAAMTGMLNLVVNYCMPLMLSTTGANWGVKGTSFFYAGTGLIGLVLVYFFIPETRGRSFIELDELFERRIPARDFRATRTTAEETAAVAHKGDDV